MRRSILLVMVALVMVVAAAGVALAVTRTTCTSVPCNGTSAADGLRERIGDGKRDVIYGLRGSDRLDAGRFTNDTDKLRGGRGHDRVWAADQDRRDKAYGGPGKHDECYVDGLREAMPSCEFKSVVIFDGPEPL
jgi:acyl-coenzyme A synthetase/AMP-(fatty) acid ligase